VTADRALRAGITSTVGSWYSTESRTVIPTRCMAELITVDSRHSTRGVDETDSSDRMDNHKLLVISSRRFNIDPDVEFLDELLFHYFLLPACLSFELLSNLFHNLFQCTDSFCRLCNIPFPFYLDVITAIQRIVAFCMLS
jgi:hypothetical protein